MAPRVSENYNHLLHKEHFAILTTKDPIEVSYADNNILTFLGWGVQHPVISLNMNPNQPSFHVIVHLVYVILHVRTSSGSLKLKPKTMNPATRISILWRSLVQRSFLVEIHMGVSQKGAARDPTRGYCQGTFPKST